MHSKAASNEAGTRAWLLTALAACIIFAAVSAVAFWPQPHSARALGVGAVSAGGAHTCVIGPGLGVKCWGLNFNGELGNGTTTTTGCACIPTPVDVSGLTSHVAAVSAGRDHTCALTTAGGVKCWGANYNGQLGDGTTTASPVPVDVGGLTSGVAAISSGTWHTCALTTSGGLKCWGYNFFGQLGNGTTTTTGCDCIPTPVNVSGLGSGVAAVSAGVTHTCALTTSGGLKCWGGNFGGELGDGTTTDSNVPINVSGLGSGVAAVSAATSFTCALTTSGGEKCWGRNELGQLGNGATTTGGCQCITTAADVSGLTSGVTALAIGDYQNHACALTTSGVKCWGQNALGQLGNGTTTGTGCLCIPAPVSVTGLGSGVAAVTVGFDHSCALLVVTATLKCWGGNSAGQLGDVTLVDSNVPVNVIASVKDSPPPPPCPTPDLPPPAAGCTQYTTTTSLTVSAPLLSGSPLACIATGVAATTRSSVADHAPANSLDDILIDIYFVSGYINCPGPYGSGSSISSGGKIEEQTNLLPGVLEFPATGDFVLCLKIYTTTVLGTIENCPVSFATPALKQPLNLHCTFSSLDSASCNVVGTSHFYDQSELKQEKAKVTAGSMELSPFGQQAPVGGVSFSPQTPASSGSHAGLFAGLGAGAVLLALACGALLARRRRV